MPRLWISERTWSTDQWCVETWTAMHEPEANWQVFGEGREGVKWELGFAFFRGWEMGFCALGLGFKKKNNRKMRMGFQFEQHRLGLWDLSWDLKKTISWEMGLGPPLHDPLWSSGFCGMELVCTKTISSCAGEEKNRKRIFSPTHTRAHSFTLCSSVFPKRFFSAVDLWLSLLVQNDTNKRFLWHFFSGR